MGWIVFWIAGFLFTLGFSPTLIQKVESHWEFILIFIMWPFLLGAEIAKIVV